MNNQKYVIRDLKRELYYVDHPTLGGVRLATLAEAKRFDSFADAAKSHGFECGRTRIVCISG